MRVHRLHVERVRGLRLVDVTFPASGPLVITGGPGSGKTTLLEAIAATKEVRAPYGGRPNAADWPGDGARLEIDWRLDEEEAREASVAPLHGMLWEPRVSLQPLDAPAANRLFSRYSRAPDIPKVEYFQAPRDFDPRSSAELQPDASLKLTRLTKSERKYAWVRSYLERSTLEYAARAQAELSEKGAIFARSTPADGTERFAKTLAALAPRLRWLGVRHEGGHVRAMFGRPRAPDAELAELTWGERMVVLFAAAYEALGLHRSVLLVDLPELGIHPADHAALFQALCALSARAQVIAATQSPGILRSLSSEQIVVLEDP